MPILICTNCNGYITFSQEEIQTFFDNCQSEYVLKPNISTSPQCPQCHLFLDEMTDDHFFEVTE